MGLPDLLTYWMQHLVASSFMVLNSSTGIPSHPLDVLTAGTEFLTASVPEWFATLPSSGSRVGRALRCGRSRWVARLTASVILQVPLPRQGSDPWRGIIITDTDFCVCVIRDLWFYPCPFIVTFLRLVMTEFSVFCVLNEFLLIMTEFSAGTLCFKWVPLYIFKNLPVRDSMLFCLPLSLADFT